MKYHTLLWLFTFVSSSCFCQKQKRAHQNDTVYVYFNHKEFQYKTYTGGSAQDSMFVYVFKKDTEFINLFKSTYLSFEDRDNNKPAPVKILKKSFLRKNKKNIITIDYLFKNGFRETFNHIYRKKIFLIDSKESKGCKIIAREVHLDSPFVEE